MKKFTILIILTLFIQSQIFTQTCLPEGITFSHQGYIDNFQSNYPNCTEIEGDVLIQDNITNLNGLIGLTTVNGYLAIVNNNNLGSLSGLDSLNYVGDKLNIIGNNSLTDLNGLNNIETIGVTLRITDNDSLSSISNLSNLNSVERINIYDCKNLLSLDGLQGLDSVRELTIKDNVLLTDLSGFDNITYAGGVAIFGIDSLISLTGLNNLTTVGVGGLSIGGNGILTNLSELSNLTSIGGRLSITFEDNLTDITGLENVTSIDGELVIFGNNTLANLYGLENIDANTISYLYIQYNPYMEICEVQSICDYLSMPNGVIEINDNATGCNSQEKVQEACDLVSINNVTLSDQLSVYPNPITTSTTFEYTLQQPTSVQISIFNHLGEQVAEISQQQSSGKQQIIWDAQGMPSGVYYYRFQTGEQFTSGKMILNR